MISLAFRMRDSISCNQHLSKEKKKLKRNMLKELRKLDSRKLRIKKELLQRFRGRESRSLEKCTKQERMLKLKDRREISLKITLTLGLKFMLQSREWDFLSTKRPTSMKFSQKLYRRILELRSLVDHSQQRFSVQKSTLDLSTPSSKRASPEVTSFTSLNSRKLKLPSVHSSSNSSKRRLKIRRKISWTTSR